MNGFDIFLLVMACLLVLVGMIKGIVRILIGVAALVAAFALAAGSLPARHYEHDRHDGGPGADENDGGVHEDPYRSTRPPD